jgi:DNA-binding LacI/PurR family transcriptional regulator
MKRNSYFKYEKIHDDLYKRILAGEFSGGKLLPEKVLAREYNVSHITLRKAIQALEDKKLVYSDSTRGTFISKTRLQEKSLKVIGLVLSNRNRSDLIHRQTIMEMNYLLQKNHAGMMIFTISSPQEIDKVIAPVHQNNLLSGLVVAGMVTGQIMEKLLSLDLPLVLQGYLTYSSPLEKKIDRVYLDSAEYAYVATLDLIERGCKNIALINGPEYQQFLNIKSGYLRALEEFSIPFKPEIIKNCADAAFADSMNLTNQILEAENIDGIFIANERMVPGVLKALRHVNFTPKIVYVGTSHSEYVNYPEISLVTCDWRILMNKVLKILFARIKDDSLPYHDCIVPFKVVHKSHNNVHKEAILSQ